ncbi:hypothetical protein Q0M94_19055 (plasmid) [Deinococcus radiomollis]|uniref:hypothetical protein n=1 Tax=Deinococcus radiomollis TaxID=468916 RepID=UPI003892402D
MKRGPLPSTTLLGISEVHDLSFAYQIGPLLRLLSAEAELLPDLLRARPWLAQRGSQQVLEALLEQEWSGFLARLGRLGPWVFAPTVADLQALSGAYTTVVEAADTSALQGAAPFPLLDRLRASGERGGQARSARGSSARAEAAEQAFWALAEARAERQRAEWAARRR